MDELPISAETRPWLEIQGAEGADESHTSEPADATYVPNERPGEDAPVLYQYVTPAVEKLTGFFAEHLAR